MSRIIFAVLSASVLISACAKPKDSGFELANFDQTVSAQTDFYHYVNGTWIKNTEIPADKPSYGSFTQLFDESEERLKEIIEEAADKPGKEDGSEEQKVGDFYLSYMDSAGIEDLGLKPMAEEMARVAALKNKGDVLNHMAHLRKIGVQTPFTFFVNQDLKQSDQYIGYLTQSGLGLPDRDYYFRDDERFKKIRARYVEHVEKILSLGGQDKPAQKAERIMEIETEVAKNHWTRVENRERDKTYNKFEIAKLKILTPSINWPAFLEAADIRNVDAVIVRQPSYFQEFNSIFNLVSTDGWKTYLTWKLLDSYASLLSADFVKEEFEFHRKTLSGIEEARPRWKRAVNAVNGTLGEVVGKIYVSKHFKPEAKKRMVELVDNLRLTFEERIKGLEWMGDETQQQAVAKLAKFNTKIGYPDIWKDYSKLVIKKDELVGNSMRSSRVEYERMVSKLGKPIDRNEWFMTPQTVNAYYNPPMNEIVFPAAILQPPFFNMAADDAVNYGGIGAVIGHEVSHGFDDQGRKSDGDGNLRDWWTQSDNDEFKRRAQKMVDQYSGFNPIDSMFVNGQLTLGENIGDLGGLTVAYHAYQKSLGGEEAPVIEGFTGDQRFFIGWAQVWRSKYRDDELRRRLVTNPHSPGLYRTNGVLANMPEFYQAFDVKEQDAMHRGDDVRVKIW